MNHYAIAIDGPAGSGKSTVAKKIASKLNILYVDTGAMYRTVAFYCIKNGIDTNDTAKVESVLYDIDMDIKQINGEQRIFLNGIDVSQKIRTQQMGEGASRVAKILAVRERLVKMQRQIADSNSVVMDGRDIATHVLKDAKFKIYLNASVEERARRRCEDFLRLGIESNFETVKQQIIVRDDNDMNREFNPLAKASDAIELNTTDMGIDDVVNTIIEMVKK